MKSSKKVTTDNNNIASTSTLQNQIETKTVNDLDTQTQTLSLINTAIPEVPNSEAMSNDTERQQLQPKQPESKLMYDN